MGRPAGGLYPKLEDGTRPPSVTGICKNDCEGLVYWAWKLGTEGKDYRKVRDDAASAGTIAHELVEASIKGEVYDWESKRDCSDEVRLAALQGFRAYQSWAEQSKLEVISTEVPLVSQAYRFAGTFDALGRLGGSEQVYLLDWKTSASIYPEYLMQIAAYKQLVEENGIAKIEGFHLCRFAKEHGDFSHHYFPDLSDAWEAFQLKRKLYDLMGALKKRVK